MGRPDTSRGFLGTILQCFRCCGSSTKEQGGADHVLQPLNLFNPRPQTSVEHLIEQSETTRHRLYSKLGSLQDFALTQATPQGAPPGPRWPAASQKFRVIHRSNGNILIISDGLSDPFDDLQSDANVNGYGLEFYIETPADELGNATPSELKTSWQFQLLFTVCSLAAGHGGIRSIIDDMHLLSTEAEGVNEAIPREHQNAFVNKAARVGALLGLSETSPTAVGYIPDKIHGMPLTDVKLVNVKLITLSELKLITELGAEGRRKLSEIWQGPDRLVSSLSRASAV